MSVVLLNITPHTIRERRYDRPNYPDPSLGALFSYLKKNAIVAEVIDSKLQRCNLAGTLEKLASLNPGAVCFTSYTHEIEWVACAAKHIRKRFPHAKLIIGGQHSNALSRHLLVEFPVFDIAVYGEGEQTLVDLIKNNFTGLDRIQGIAYRKNTEAVVNERRDFLDMEKIPVADWSRFPRTPYYPLFTSRGCGYQCVFCSRPFGRKLRYRPINDVIEEIRMIHKQYHPKAIHIWDENFCADKTRTVELLMRIKNDRCVKGLKWFCQTHVNNLDYELIRLMKESGCVRMGIGIESGNEEILKKIGKGISKKRIVQVTGWLKKARIPIEGFFLFGLPGETLLTCKETIQFAAKLNPEFPVFGIVVPYPGTEIYTMALRGENGYRIISQNWRDYNKMIGNAMELDDVSRRKMEFFQMYGCLYVLLKNVRIFSMIRFVFQYSHDIGSYLKHFLLRSKRSRSRTPSSYN